MARDETDIQHHTIGDVLRSVRVRAGFSIEKFSQTSGVRDAYLIAFERNSFGELPSQPYILGILKKYSVLCDVSYEELFTVCVASGCCKTSGKLDTLPKNRFAQPKHFLWEKFDMHPALWLAIAVAAYVLFQIGYLAMPVRIILSQQYDVSHDNPVVLEGMFRGYVRAAWLNGEYISIKQNTFRQSVYLNPGVNTIEIRAVNFFRSETTQKKIIVYEKQREQTVQSELIEQIASPEPVMLNASFAPTPSPEI